MDDSDAGKAEPDLEGRILKIRSTRLRFTLQVLIGNAVWYGLLVLSLRDLQKANYVFTNTFQFLAVAWCCWFMLPYFLRMEVKTDLGLQQGREVAATLSRVAADLKPIIDDAKAIVHDLRQAVEKYSRDDVVKGVIAEIRKELDSEGGVVKRLEGKFDEVVAVFTRPLGGPARPGLLERGLQGGARPGPGNGAEAAAPGAGGEGGGRGA